MNESIEYNLLDNLNEKNNNNGEDEKNNLLESVKLKDLDSSVNIDMNFNPKNQDDLNLIITMGYDPKMAKKVYVLLNPVDINEAIDFLTEENGIYQHDFMERHGKEDVCFICGFPAKNHINYIPPENQRKSILDSIRDSLGRSRNNIDNVNKLSIVVDDKKYEDKNNNNSNAIICELCYEDMTQEEKEKNTIECGHLYCSDCYLNYLLDKINNNKVGKINCMDHKCWCELDEEFILSHLTEEKMKNKYKKFKLRDKLYQDPNVKFCPTKDCESYARRKDEKEKYVTCQEGHKFCFVCLKPWHGSKNCQDEIDVDFKKWKKNKIVKKCPKCKMWTEKNLGCNHMTCAECKYQWCWLCGGKYTEGHFQIGGSCSGLQFSDSELFNNCFCLCLYKIWVLFYQMIIMMFLIPIYAFVKTSKYMDYDLSNCCASLFAFPIWFFLSISNLCLYVCIGTFLFIISLFFRCIKEKILEEMFDSY
jgi:hypothetical protein